LKLFELFLSHVFSGTFLKEDLLLLLLLHALSSHRVNGLLELVDHLVDLSLGHLLLGLVLRLVSFVVYYIFFHHLRRLLLPTHEQILGRNDTQVVHEVGRLQRETVPAPGELRAHDATLELSMEEHAVRQGSFIDVVQSESNDLS